jgi:hypothetical protein
MLYRQLLTILCAFCFVAGVNAYAAPCELPKHDSDEPCFPDIKQRIRHNDDYKMLYCALSPMVDQLQTLLDNFLNNPMESTYDPLYDAAIGLSSSTGAQVIIARGNGQVVVDTYQPADLSCAGATGGCGDVNPNNCLASTATTPFCCNNYLANGFCHFMNDAVGPNQNNEVTVMAALLQPCGLGVATGFSPALGGKTAYLTIRLGKYLNSSGTATIAQVVSSN